MSDERIKVLEDEIKLLEQEKFIKTYGVTDEQLDKIHEHVVNKKIKSEYPIRLSWEEGKSILDNLNELRSKVIKIKDDDVEVVYRAIDELEKYIKKRDKKVNNILLSITSVLLSSIVVTALYLL